MRVVRLGVSVGLWSPRSPTMSTAFEFTPQLPVPAGIRTVPLGSVPRPLSRQNIIRILYRTEPLVSHPFWKVQCSAVRRIWVVHSNELIIFQRTTLENVSLREKKNKCDLGLERLTSGFHLLLSRSSVEVKDLVGSRSRMQRVRKSVLRGSGSS